VLRGPGLEVGIGLLEIPQLPLCVGVAGARSVQPPPRFFPGPRGAVRESSYPVVAGGRQKVLSVMEVWEHPSWGPGCRTGLGLPPQVRVWGSQPPPRIIRRAVRRDEGVP
jgi:hypothetical protein